MFKVFTLTKDKKRLHRFEYQKVRGGTSSLHKARQISTFIELPPGRHVIIPFTYDPQVCIAFHLKIFSNEDLQWVTSANAMPAIVNEEERLVDINMYCL
jgi:hypothetical protein